MMITVTDEAITSCVTPHYAWRVDSERWAVSWLPGRGLIAEDAKTAMLIAELVWRVPGVRTLTAIRLASQGVFFGAGVL